MVNWLNLSCSWLYKFNCYTRDSLKLKCMVSSTWFGKNVCNLASSSPKIPCGMLRCSVYRPLRLNRIDRIFSCPSCLYGCQYVSISNKIPTFLAPKCQSLISRIFFKCSSSENHSKLLMIKLKELRNGRRTFQLLNLKLKVFWEFSRIISCSPDPSLRPEVRWSRDHEVLSLLVNLRNRTGEKRRRQPLRDKRDDNFVWINFSPNFTFL